VGTVIGSFLRGSRTDKASAYYEKDDELHFILYILLYEASWILIVLSPAKAGSVLAILIQVFIRFSTKNWFLATQRDLQMNQQRVVDSPAQ